MRYPLNRPATWLNWSPGSNHCRGGARTQPLWWGSPPHIRAVPISCWSRAPFLPFCSHYLLTAHNPTAATKCEVPGGHPTLFWDVATGLGGVVGKKIGAGEKIYS